MINLSLVVDLPKTWSRDGNNFDISKASKKVWYAGHIDKLIGLKVPMHIVSFIKSLITDRTFRVKENGKGIDLNPVQLG